MHAYEKIRTEMLQRISQQVWPAGSSLPHEEQLAEEFGVARGTVRRAMEQLVDQGLLERKRKAGTKVAARNAHSSTLTIPVVRREVTDSGAEYGYSLLSARKGGRPLDRSGYFAGAPLLHICCLHLSDGRPYQLEDRLINLAVVPEAEVQDFSEISPNEWLLQKVPYSSVCTTLKAEAADAKQSRHLQIAQHSPVFVIERQTRLDKQQVTLVRMSHPAAGFSIITQTNWIDIPDPE
ncbi:GntR family transcriptional regulator [Pontixanthobacter aquaemixtae]|nr:GntR family transcriptional regulator [Pontixanthobacter aquaemixtae]